MKEFWKALVSLSRLAVILAALSLVTGVYAWLPFERTATWMLFPMHLATMIVLFWVFGLIAKHNFIAFKHRKTQAPKIFLPRRYWLLTVGSLILFLAVFIGALNYYPPRTDLGNMVYLRIFSFGWLFLNLAAVGFAQWAGLRLRAFKTAA